MTTKIFIPVNFPYDFAKSVTDHGWYMLAPNKWVEERGGLQRIERLNNGIVVYLQISYNLSSTGQKSRGVSERGKVVIEVEALDRLDSKSIDEIKNRVIDILRLQDDLSEFYDFAKINRTFWRKIKSGRGRLLRSSTLFEDVVKVICTTNTTWKQTKGMVQRLVEKLGSPFPLSTDIYAFPTPEQVASVDLSYFQEHIRLGYRNEYVLELARNIVSGKINLEQYKSAQIGTKELKKKLKKIKGVGDYSTHTLLMLLGHYDEIAVDSEFRTYVKNKYFAGRVVADREMLSIYDSWGKWKYLAFWLEREDYIN